MGITVTFETFEEMKEFAAKVAGMENTGEAQAAPVKPERTDSKAAEAEKAQSEEPDKEKPKTGPDAADYKLEDVRAKLAELNKSGKRAQVKELLASFGAEKLTGIPEEKYGELMEKAGEL